MPDDFGDLERQVLERLEEEQAEYRRRAIRATFDQEAYDREADAFFAATAAPASSPVEDDAIGLVDPADGALKMYSRAEIRARVRARRPGRVVSPPGAGVQITAYELTESERQALTVSKFDDVNGYAGTFDRPLKREVELQRPIGICGAIAVTAGGVIGGGFAIGVLIRWAMH